jgi:hypothetical protein
MSNVENYPGPSKHREEQQPENHPNATNPEQVQPVSKKERDQVARETNKSGKLKKTTGA